MQLDGKEILVRLVKYLIEGFVVAICAFYIPGKKVHINEVVTLGFVAAATFSILDLFAPSIGASARSGSGFAIGSSVAGGLSMAH